MSDVSPKWQITEPVAARTDAADVPLYVRNIVAALEAKGVQYGQGTLAARPAASTAGRLYYATDQSPPKVYMDTGAAWNEIGTLAAGAIGTTQIADNSITNPKMADDSVGAAEIIADSVGSSEIAPQAVTSAEIANALKPSSGAGAGTEALRALGTAAGTAAAGAHAAQHASGGADPLTVTMAMLEALIVQALPQPGDIKWVGYNVVAGSEPTGWLLADGRAVSRATFSALFTKYGVTHGAGDGVNTFNLPDIRGKSPVGIGQGAGLTLRTIGQTGGEELHVSTVNETPPHSHLMAHDHAMQMTNGLVGMDVPTRGSGSGGVFDIGGSGASAPIKMFNGSTSPQGGGAGHNTMHPWIALTPLVKT